MYLGVDVGGTKTLLATLDDNGVILEKNKFPTCHDYKQFLIDLKNSAASLKNKNFYAGVAGITGPRTDRERGIGINFSNLPWRNVPIVEDFELIFNCPLAIENDAKLAALSEAMLLKDSFQKVLYVTISTGIGFGWVVNGVIDTTVGDGGGRTILLDHDGELTPWEDFAGGRAIVARYGKKAEDITDEETWKAICRDLSKGFIHLIAILQPEVIVIGGSVGSYFDRYGDLLSKDIAEYNIPLVKLPVLVQAQRPEEAVVYGCYDLAKQKFPDAKNNK